MRSVPTPWRRSCSSMRSSRASVDDASPDERLSVQLRASEVSVGSAMAASYPAAPPADVAAAPVDGPRSALPGATPARDRDDAAEGGGGDGGPPQLADAPPEQ